jgi:hypothetical protein
MLALVQRSFAFLAMLSMVLMTQVSHAAENLKILCSVFLPS